MLKITNDRIRWLVLIICSIGFIILYEDVYFKETMQIDDISYNIISNIINDKLTLIVKMITNLGSATCLILLCIFILLNNKRIGIYVTTNLILISIINVILKNLIQRPRPTIYPLILETGYSFPSGHSMASMAFYGYLIYLIYKHISNTNLKYTLMFMLGILIILIGISRVYLGVHYISDVIAGFLISITYLLLYTKTINNIERNRE